MSVASVMLSNHLILSRTLLLLPSIFPSIKVFSNESVLPNRWPKWWCFCFSISLSNECSGLISFRIDWLDLLAVQGTLKSLLQYHSVLELWCLRRLLRVLWTPRRSNQSILKEITPEYSLEGLMLKLKLWPPDAKSRLTGKDSDAGKDWRRRRRR